MGILDQFAKETFASETSVVTRGAMAWQVPPEIRLSHVHADGMLSVLDGTADALKALPSPWREARGHTEILVEVKMQGDHLNEVMMERALLRRQVRQVQRMEATEPPWLGQLPIWLTGPIRALGERRVSVE